MGFWGELFSSDDCGSEDVNAGWDSEAAEEQGNVEGSESQ